MRGRRDRGVIPSLIQWDSRHLTTEMRLCVILSWILVWKKNKSFNRRRGVTGEASWQVISENHCYSDFVRCMRMGESVIDQHAGGSLAGCHPQPRGSTRTARCCTLGRDCWVYPGPAGFGEKLLWPRWVSRWPTRQEAVSSPNSRRIEQRCVSAI